MRPGSWEGFLEEVVFELRLEEGGNSTASEKRRGLQGRGTAGALRSLSISWGRMRNYGGWGRSSAG